MSAEFDKYSASYGDEVTKALGFSRVPHGYYTEVKVNWILSFLSGALAATRRPQVLDVGCGDGGTDRLLIPHVDGLRGVDVSSAMIAQARSRNPEAEYAWYDGKRLPFDDQTFHLTFAICVMHHVPVQDWAIFVSELARVTKPGGYVVIFEHNRWNPATRLVVKRCPFDKEAVLVAASKLKLLMTANTLVCERARYILLTPFAVAPMQWLERMCRSVPFGAQYFVAAKKSEA